MTVIFAKKPEVFKVTVHNNIAGSALRGQKKTYDLYVVDQDNTFTAENIAQTIAKTFTTNDITAKTDYQPSETTETFTKKRNYIKRNRKFWASK